MCCSLKKKHQVLSLYRGGQKGFPRSLARRVLAIKSKLQRGGRGGGPDHLPTRILCTILRTKAQGQSSRRRIKSPNALKNWLPNCKHCYSQTKLCLWSRPFFFHRTHGWAFCLANFGFPPPPPFFGGVMGLRKLKGASSTIRKEEKKR